MASPPHNFEEVVNSHYRDVFRFAMSLINREADAVDLTQEVFLRYAKKGDQLEDVSKVKSWLFRTLKNEFIDQVRRSKRYEHVELESAPVQSLLADDSTAGFSGIDAESALAALQSLEENYRIPLSLFYLEGYSYKEIADLLEIPVGTVMSRLSRGKERLRAAFGTETCEP